MITQNKLKEVLYYNPETGYFFWKQKISKKVVVGQKAGCLRKDGYINIRILGVPYLVHRLAWLYVYGNFPKYQIDHINGIKSDNRIRNLQDVNGSTNLRNATKSKNNTSGYTGVSWNKRARKWQVHINDNLGNKINLGDFKNIEEAIKVRKKAEIKYGYSKRHGSEETE